MVTKSFSLFHNRLELERLEICISAISCYVSMPWCLREAVNIFNFSLFYLEGDHLQQVIYVTSRSNDYFRRYKPQLRFNAQ